MPFRRCDSYNLGVSRFCDVIKNAFDPPKYGNQVLQQFNKASFTRNIQDTTRYYRANDTFGVNEDKRAYDAYEKDIAMLQIYFKKSTAVQIGTRPRMTWIDFMSAVGGLSGLVLGMGFVSGIELVWLCLRLLSRWLQLTSIIRWTDLGTICLRPPAEDLRITWVVVFLSIVLLLVL